MKTILSEGKHKFGSVLSSSGLALYNPRPLPPAKPLHLRHVSFHSRPLPPPKPSHLKANACKSSRPLLPPSLITGQTRQISSSSHQDEANVWASLGCLGMGGDAAVESSDEEATNMDMDTLTASRSSPIQVFLKDWCIIKSNSMLMLTMRITIPHRSPKWNGTWRVEPKQYCTLERMGHPRE